MSNKAVHFAVRLRPRQLQKLEQLSLQTDAPGNKAAVLRLLIDAAEVLPLARYEAICLTNNEAGGVVRQDLTTSFVR